MPELIAQGIQPAQRWRRWLPPEEAVELGRTTPTFAVPWDSRISRCHVRLTLHEDRVNVVREESAANPVFHNGAQEDIFWLKPGEHFVIGETTFTLTADRAEATMDVPMPVSQQTFTHDFLQRVQYRDADRRIEVLSQLPDLISSAGEETELLTRIVNTLMEGIPSASSIGIVRGGQSSPTEESDVSDLKVLHWDRRGANSGDFEPSARLIGEAGASGETVLHIWHVSQRKSKGDSADYTFDYENDWAFCCPLVSPATDGWAIYVAGVNRPEPPSTPAVGAGERTQSFDSGSGMPDLQGDIKFCELVASTLKNLLRVQQLDRRQASLRNFFSPVVLQAIAHRDPDDVLAPRECRVSVLFCDLRGFSRKSEQLASDLPELLQRVSDALGIMTHNILDNGGVIGDFHGDAAMGFWGWPLDGTSTATRAVNAAVGIRETFAALADDAEHPLHDFQVGIGIATGLAVAGKIGSRDQVKVTAFGPVVNLASRLEGMTRWLGTQVLVDQTTATEAKVVSTSNAQPQPSRLLGSFQPYGMSNPIDVHELMANSADKSDAYAAALAAFNAGDWCTAADLLRNLSSDDSARQFLENHIQRHNGVPPEDWTGVIRMRAK